jgi:hypothetical protein
MYPYFVYFLIAISITLTGCVLVYLLYYRKKPLISLLAANDPLTEQIKVPSYRITLLSLVLALLGGMLAFLLINLVSGSNWKEPATYVFLLLLALSLFMLYSGITLFRRRNTTMQLELADTYFRHKPIKWYSYSRGGYNGLSVIFSKAWVSHAYTDILNIGLTRSAWSGHRIYFYTTGHKKTELILLTDNNEQVEAIYARMQEKLRQNRV